MTIAYINANMMFRLFLLVLYCCSIAWCFNDTFGVDEFGDARHRKTKLECKDLYKTHNVIPGQSWGTMSTAQQNRWMEIRCDRYFCQPNKMESKGIYKCIRIKSSD